MYTRLFIAILALNPALGCNRRAAPSAPQSLLEAAVADDLGAAQRLLAPGVDVNQRDAEGNTPLMCSPDYNLEHDTAMIDLLLAHGADVNCRNRGGETALTLAARCGRDDIVERLIAHGADVNQGNAKSQSPLLLAIAYPRVVDLLLRAGTNVNAKDLSGETVIFDADVNLMARLVALGADVNIEDADGHTPVWAAVVARTPTELNFLVAHGARLDREGPGAQELLLRAMLRKNDTMLDALVDLGVDVNATDDKGFSLLTGRVYPLSNTVAIEWLLNAGFDLQRRNPYGYTAREWAEKTGHFNIEALMERYENGVQHPDRSGDKASRAGV